MILIISGNIPPGSPGGGAPPFAGGRASPQTLKAAIALVLMLVVCWCLCLNAYCVTM
jgi:hypothetical protein